MWAVIAILVSIFLLYFVGIPMIMLAWLASEIWSVSRLALLRLKGITAAHS